VIHDGIPILIPPSRAAARTPAWERQRSYFDESVDAEFEIGRPEAGGRFYKYVVGAKFRRALESPMLGASFDRVLDACCGSGVLSGELARRTLGLLVGFDFSLGAVRRACERARRRGYPFIGVVGDAFVPPFAAGTFDLVAVHDALHHVEQPLVALARLAALSHEAFVVMEPSASWLTRLAVLIGFSTDVEEAGNRVRRFRTVEIEEVVRNEGFQVVNTERYVMYYPHQPGKLYRLFDHSLLFPIGRLAVSLGGVLGRAGGNKLQVVARR
jgi:SAM-dependent methyltransferase